MHEKPKISHFADYKNGRQKAPDISATETKRAGLGKLYPSPKTYEQRQSAELLRQLTYVRRLTKYPSLYIATYGSIVVGLTLLYFQNLDKLWFGSSDRGITMSVIFFSFLIGIIILFLDYAWIKYVMNMFYALGRSTQLFWIANGILLMALIALGQNQTLFLSNSLSAILFIVLYFVFTLGTSSIIIKGFHG